MTIANASDEFEKDQNLKESLVRLKKTLARHLIKKHPDLLFGILRSTIPVLSIRKNSTVLISRHEHARELLNSRFLSDFAPAASCFSSDDSASLLSHDDPVGIVEATARAMQEAIPKADEQMEIDLVGDISRRVPARIIDSYFGISGLEFGSLCERSKSLQPNLLLSPDVDDEAQESVLQKITETCTEIRTYVDNLIADRYRKLEANPDLNDKLSQFLKESFPASISEDGKALVYDVVKALTAGIETVNVAVVNVINEILNRPEIHKEATKAANANNDRLLFTCCREALRLNPVNPYIYLIAESDYRIAAGTWHSKWVTAGTTIIVSMRSASRDGRNIPAPDAFCIDRSSSHYLQPGLGFPPNVLAAVLEKEAVEIIKCLLRLPDLQAVSQVNYHHGFNPDNVSAFPESYYLTFEPRY